jgi:hypothetical protein
MPATDPATELAIVAQGNVTVATNTSGTPAIFQGLLYTNGNLAVNGTAANPISVGGTVIAQGNVSLANTVIVGISQCSALRFTVWQPGLTAGSPPTSTTPVFGTTLADGAGPSYWAQDATGTGSAFFVAGDITNIKSAITNGLTGAGSYGFANSGSTFPLASVTSGAATMTVHGLDYDANQSRYVLAYPPFIQFNAGAAGRSVMDAALTAPVTTQGLASQFYAAQGLAGGEANNLLTGDEATFLAAPTVAGMPAGTGVGTPPVFPLQTLTLNLNAFVGASPGTNNMTIVSERSR